MRSWHNARVLELTAELLPARLPATRCDVTLRLVLHNASSAPISLATDVAKLAAVASYAGVGITWGIDIAGVKLRELRSWYGPPGNPPAPSVITQASRTLAPGASKTVEMQAAWLPNSVLEPRHLANLDPQGMDGLGDVSGASVLVFFPRGLDLEADDFLRGHVVAFFPGSGSYELRASYTQAPWMGVGEQHHAVAAPITLAL